MTKQEIEKFCSDFAEVTMTQAVLQSYSDLIKYEPAKVVLQNAFKDMTKLQTEMENILITLKPTK